MRPAPQDPREQEHAPVSGAVFVPSVENGLRLDAALRFELAASIDGIADAVDGAFDIDREALAALTAAIRAHKVRPAVMGLYASLVPALLHNEPQAIALLARLAEPKWRGPADFHVITIDDHDLGDGIAAIYREHINDDPEVPLRFRPLDKAAMPEARLRVRDAMALLERADPRLAGEIQALINEIVVVRHDIKGGGFTFDGASSFHLWGALVLNIEAFPTRLHLLQGLAHEAAHALLHGLTMGKNTVLNDPADRYASPLRDDDRPMEGVVHASFVLARMHYALAAVFRLKDLDEMERAWLKHELSEKQHEFTAGLRIVRAGACFTERAAAAFNQAEAYMARSTGTSL